MDDFEINRLRGYINEPTNAEPYTDEELAVLVQMDGSLEATAARVWRSKAARYAHLVNTSEGGSSRSNGDLYKNAIAMADMYSKAATPVTPPVSADRPSRTRHATRV